MTHPLGFFVQLSGFTPFPALVVLQTGKACGSGEARITACLFVGSAGQFSTIKTNWNFSECFWIADGPAAAAGLSFAELGVAS